MSTARRPEILPIFPLTGSLLLPGNFLPLNIFEPRYRNMVQDAMQGARLIGMIQPRTPMPDNRGPTPGQVRPELYAVGCAGRIEECEPQSDGRYLIVLRGLRRFRVGEELAPRRGYRRVRPEYDEFEHDGEPDQGLDPARLLVAVRHFAERHRLDFDFDLLSSLPAVTLVNALSAALPFPAGERQALLEAPANSDREQILLELMGMSMEPLSGGEVQPPPTVN